MKYTCGKFFFANRYNLVNELANYRQCEITGAFDCDAVGDRRKMLCFDRLASLQRQIYRSDVRRLDTDNPYVRKQRLHGNRDSRNDTAASDRHDDNACFGQALRDLEPDRSLPCDNTRIIERVNIRVTLFLLELARTRNCLIECLAIQYRLRSK